MGVNIKIQKHDRTRINPATGQIISSKTTGKTDLGQSREDTGTTKDAGEVKEETNS